MESALPEIAKYGGILGPIIVVLIISNLGLAAYIRSLVNENFTMRNKLQDQFNSVYEARIIESKAAVTFIEGVTSNLKRFGDLLTTDANINQKILIAMDSLSNAISHMSIQNKEYVQKLDSSIRDNRIVVLEIREGLGDLTKCCDKSIKLIEQIKQEVKS